MPRFETLASAFPQVRLRLVTSDYLRGVDIDQIDVAIVWDDALLPGWSLTPLFEEEVFPVCAPSYLSKVPSAGQDPSALAAARLLHFDGLGLRIFAGVGGLCLIGAGQFLNRWRT